MENCTEFPKKIKKRTLIQSEILLLDMYLKKSNKLMNIYTSMFIGALFIIDKWIRMWYIHAME